MLRRTIVVAPYQKPPVKPVLFSKTANTRNDHDHPTGFPAGVEYLQPGPALRGFTQYRLIIEFSSLATARHLAPRGDCDAHPVLVQPCYEPATGGV